LTHFFSLINEECFLKLKNTSENVTQKNNMEDFFKKEMTLENEQHSRGASIVYFIRVYSSGSRQNSLFLT